MPNRDTDDLEAQISAIPAEVITSVRLDSAIVRANIAVLLEALERPTARATLSKLLTKEAYDTKVLSHLRAAGDLFVAASDAATALLSQHSSREISTKLAKVMEFREVLLSNAKGLAAAKVLPGRSVEAISRGVGPRDAIKDVLALVELFEANAAALKGKSPISTALLADAKPLATLLDATVLPKGSKRARNRAADEATERALRVFAVVVKLRDIAWRWAALVYGEDLIDEVAPRLGSRSLPGRPKKAAKVVEP